MTVTFELTKNATIVVEGRVKVGLEGKKEKVRDQSVHRQLFICSLQRCPLTRVATSRAECVPVPYQTRV